MTFHVFLLAHSHMYAHINAYRTSLPAYCLAWHQFPLTQMVVGEWDTKRDRNRGDGCLHELISGPFLLPSAHTFFPYNTCTCPICTSIHLPPIHPSLLYLAYLNLSLPHSSIHQCSMLTLRTILGLPPTHHSSIQSTRSIKPDPTLYHDLLHTY